ncbi:Acetyltransferase [Sulfitobacter noctilucae]|nr:Acetyltransferase [Sulfitobacter noctilucae]
MGPPADDPAAFDVVLAHSGTQVLGAFVGDDLAAMVTLHLLPNVLWQGRPYGLIENVVTRQRYQRQGFGRRVMQAAIEAACAKNAYKLMLMTGRARGATGFYEALGFSGKDKFAMVLRQE